MKKTAVVIDFDPKFLKNTGYSEQYDLFVLDRMNEKIDNIEVSDHNDFNSILNEETTVAEFYHTIAPNYKDILCLFLSYNYLNVDDHLMTERINNHREPYQAKMYAYLINNLNQDRQKILQTAMEMIDKGYEIRDIIVRIHAIRKKETYSINDLLFKYISSIL